MFKTAENKMKKGGLFLAAAFVIFGLLILLMPRLMTVVNAWFILGALIANGFYKMFIYLRLPKEMKNGWILANSVVSLALGLVVLIDICVTPILATLGVLGGMGILLGGYEVFFGVSQLFSVKAAKALSKSVGWTIFCGALNIVCGIFIMSYPIASVFAFEWISAFFFVVMGATMLIETIIDAIRK